MSSRTLLRWALVLLAVVATVAASTPWERGSGIPHTFLILGLASAFPVVVPLVVEVFAGAAGSRRWWLVPLVSALAWLVFTMTVVLESLTAFSALVNGIFHAAESYISEPLPILEPRTVLVLPALLCWLTGSVAYRALRSNAWVPWTAALWLGMFTLAYAMTSAAPNNSEIGAGLLLVLVGAVWVLARRWQEEVANSLSGDGKVSSLQLRTTMVALALLVVGAVLAGFLISSNADVGAAANTLKRNPPVQTEQSLSPPTEFQNLREEAEKAKDNAPLFTIQVDTRVPGYIPVAELSTYNGATWVLPQNFAPDGGGLSRPIVSGLTVIQHYQVKRNFDHLESDVTLPWMPYLTAPQQVTGVQIRVDQSSGTIAPVQTLAAGTAFSVKSTVSTATTGHKGDLLASDLTDIQLVVGIPPSESQALTDSLKQISQQGVLPSCSIGSPIASVAYMNSLTDCLAQHGALQQNSLKATITNDGLTYLEVTQAVLHDLRATPEQYATMLTLLARTAGIPARLVVGFRLRQGKQLPTNTPYPVVAGDATTWVEVPVEGKGWLVFDPTAHMTATPAKPSTQPESSVTTTTAPAQLKNPEIPQHRFKPVHVNPPVRPAGFPWWLAVPVGTLAAIALVVLLPRMVLGRRMRRRGRGDPRERLAGAWQQGLEDLYVTTGQPVASLSGDEAVSTALKVLGPPSASLLSSIRDQGEVALYATRAMIDPVTADEAWENERTLRREALRSLHWTDRVRSEFRVLRAPRAGRKSSHGPR